MSKVGGFYFERSVGDSPETFVRVCEVTDIPEFGQTNEQVEDTTFCSNGKKTYVPGLADGMDLSITANREPESTVQAALKADVESKLTWRYRFVEELDGSPANAFTFAAAALHWGIAPSQSLVNKFMFGAKISGDIDESVV